MQYIYFATSFNPNILINHPIVFQASLLTRQMSTMIFPSKMKHHFQYIYVTIFLCHITMYHHSPVTCRKIENTRFLDAPLRASFYIAEKQEEWNVNPNPRERVRYYITI